jgi:hypothetical protein
MDVETCRSEISPQSAVACTVFALIHDLRGWDESIRDSVSFTGDDVRQHIIQIGLPEQTIVLAKECLNESIRRLHAAKSLPEYFVPLNGNTEDVEQYLIH